MNKITSWLAIAIIVCTSGAATASPITYNINRSVSTFGSVTGTITTDGTLGVLGKTNILEWNLSVNADVNQATVGTLFSNIGAYNSTLSFFPASALSANSSGFLLFDFGAPSMQIFQITDVISSVVWQMQGGIPFQDELVRESGPGFPVQQYEFHGAVKQVVGTSTANPTPVPAPQTIWLLLLGLGILVAPKQMKALRQSHGASMRLEA